MARMIKCPRCQAQIDVTNMAGGSTVPCADCGVMLRVPTGQTGVRPAVPAAVPPQGPAAPAGVSRPRERQTPLFRRMASARAPGERKAPPRPPGERMAGRRRSSGPVVAIAVIVLIVGLIAILAVSLVARNRRLEAEARAKAEKREETKRKAMEQAAANRKLEQQWAEEEARRAAEAARKGEKPQPGQIIRRAPGEYDIPASFEPGARKVAERQVKELVILPLDPALRKEYESLAAAGRVDDIVKDDSKWMGCIIDALLSDDEKVARTTYQALHRICEARKISSKEDSFVNPIKLEHFNSSYVRGGEYVFWTEWWSKNQENIKQWATGPQIVGENPDFVKWDGLVRDLRSGGYDDPNHPGGRAMLRIKLMGKAAWPHLIKYIDHEDIMIGKAVVTVLNELTQQNRPLPNETTKAHLKAEWESWLKKNQ